jgi:hypothetical protein
MVPEYLTPTNGGLLSPGQLMVVTKAAFARFAGPEVSELVLEVPQDVRVGKVSWWRSRSAAEGWELSRLVAGLGHGANTGSVLGAGHAGAHLQPCPSQRTGVGCRA